MDIQKIIWYIFVLTTFLWTVLFFISCEERIELRPFVDKQIAKKANNSLSLKTVSYKYVNKIIITWKKVPKASYYFVYEFKHKTGTIASKSNPDYIAGANTLKYTTNISSNVTGTRYFVVVAKDKENNVLFESNMIEGKTLGQPIINESQIQKTFYSIKFRWSPVEGVQKYTIQRKKKDGDYELMHAPIHSEEGSWVFLDEDVTPEDSYDYRIIAYAMDGAQVIAQNDYTFKSSIQVPRQEAPSSINNFMASKHVYSDRILLMWEKPDDLEGFDSNTLRYSIYRREKNSHATDTFSYLTSITSQELNKPKNVNLNIAEIFKKEISNLLVYEDTTAKTNKVYEYKIIALYDNKKPGKPSTIVEGAVIPQVRDVVVNEYSNGVVLEWSVPSDFRGTAEVYRSRGGLVFESIREKISESSYKDTKLHLQIKYTYKVRFLADIAMVDESIRNDWNKGVFSNPVDYKHTEITNYDFNFLVSRNKKDSVLFTWKIPKDDSTEADDFSIERMSIVDGSEIFEVISSLKIEVKKDTGSAILPVSPVSFKPTIYRLVWTSGDNKKYSKVMLGDVLHAPTDITATKAEHAKYITVRWNPSSGAKKYQVKLKKHGSANTDWSLYQFGTNDFVLPQNNNNGTQEVRITPPENDRPITRGIEYDIRIVAIGADDLSDTVESSIVQGSTFGPAGIHVQVTKGSSKDKITVSWNAHPYADEYIIFRKTKDTSKEFKIAKIPSESGKKTYKYHDVVDNPDYLPLNVPSLEKIYFQEYEYSIVPKKSGVSNPMSSVKDVGYLLGSPRDITASDRDYKDKIIVRWTHIGAVEYVVYVSNEKNEEYEEIEKIIVESQPIGSDIEYEHVLSGTIKNRYYKVRSTNARGEMSRMPDETGLTRGRTLDILFVTGVQASDVDYNNDVGIYIAKHGSDTSQYSAKEHISKIDRGKGISYATKITWKPVLLAKKYYIYRMDFNEITNFWRKIGERTSSDALVFFDTKSLVLREYRSLYWVVAFFQEKDGNWLTDSSLEGDAEILPQHTSFASLSFEKFDAGNQTKNIQKMSKNANIDVGSRWITPREYLNWSLGVIGDGVYELYNKNSTLYGLSYDSWSYIVNFTMNEYSLGVKALNLRNSRKDRKSTELVVNSNGALSGTFSESCPKGDGLKLGCYGAIVNARLGAYIGNNKAISVNSPYGIADVTLSGTGTKSPWGVSVTVEDGLHYDFDEGSISFTWLGKNYKFSKKDNTGTSGPLNPYVTPIRFNRDYASFLKAVYDVR